MRDYITLKWGTLKAWKLSSKKGEELTQKYIELNRSSSATDQKDTPEQRKIIFDMIDECKYKIWLCWEARYVTKQEAKNYILNYGKEEVLCKN